MPTLTLPAHYFDNKDQKDTPLSLHAAAQLGQPVSPSLVDLACVRKAGSFGQPERVHHVTYTGVNGWPEHSAGVLGTQWSDSGTSSAMVASRVLAESDASSVPVTVAFALASEPFPSHAL